MQCLQRVASFLEIVQRSLFPHLESVLDSPVIQQHRRLVYVLELARVEEFIQSPRVAFGVGRPEADRRKLARAFIAKACLNLTETTDLIERLQTDRTLRKLCGWREGERLPSAATFSRAFAVFARLALYDLVHERRVIEYLDDSVTEHLCYDTTAIAARERPVKKTASAPAAPPVKKKRGRPKRGEERPAPEPTVSSANGNNRWTRC